MNHERKLYLRATERKQITGINKIVSNCGDRIFDIAVYIIYCHNGSILPNQGRKEKESRLREIKFRVWDRQVGHIFPEVQTCEDFGSVCADRKSKRFEFMQYTGLKDKNGKEIYEGDIVIVSGEDKPHLGNNEIVWEDDFARFSLLKRVENAGLYDPDAYLCGIEPIHILEVVGNIYENKELLEGGEK